MAKLKTKATKDLNLEVDSLLNKSRVWVGLVIVLLAVGAGIYLMSNGAKDKEKSQIADLVSPNPSAIEVNPSPVASASSKPTALVKKVKTLADTNGKIELTVQPGDSFWRISERACGNGRYFLDIQSDLGYTNQAIHPGDKLVIICPE